MTNAAPVYRERLVPGPGLFIALLLLLPAVALVFLPINQSLSIPMGVLVYLIITVSLFLMSPVIRIADGELVAGRASIPVQQLGRVELLGDSALRAAIGAGGDARNYLLVRGWIHRGVRVENIDENDPAPAWIITTRHPEKLAQTIEAAQTAD